MGQSVAAVGDLDGDGVVDIIVGGLSSPATGDLGRVLVFSSKTHDRLLRYEGTSSTPYHYYSDEFGASVAGGGDADGDGKTDFAVGAPYYPSLGAVQHHGRVYLFSGSHGDTIQQLDGLWWGSEFGHCLAFAGDLNEDGHDDLLVGSPEMFRTGFRWGRVYAYSGLDGSLMYELVGDIKFGEFGGAIAVLDDLDGDSVNDFVVGSHGRSHTGVFSGRTGSELYRNAGQDEIDGFGFSVCALEDVDGDGHSDFAVGAPSSCCDSVGRVYVFSGSSGAELTRIQSQTPHTLFGYAVASAGDIDLDGVADVLAGSPSEGIGGRAFVFSGRTGNKMYALCPQPSSQRLGWGAAYLGDIDADGHGDVAVCAAGGLGSTYIYSFCDVEADVLPGQCPNIISDDAIESNRVRPTAAYASPPGRLTAAFVGSGSLDVADIDTSTVLLEGVPAVSVRIRDVTAPSWIKDSPCDCAARSADGYPDLVVQFDLNAVRAAITKETILRPSDVVNMTAVLKTGEPIIGRDCLRINPVSSILAGIDSLPSAHMSLSEMSNSPNPFNSSTTISYSMSSAANVRIDIFDVLGRRVITLVDDELEAGEHRAVWNGQTESGTNVASGVYFCRMSSEAHSETKKLVLLR